MISDIFRLAHRVISHEKYWRRSNYVKFDKGDSFVLIIQGSELFWPVLKYYIPCKHPESFKIIYHLNENKRNLYC